jgi:outer membrane receptor protein involved in Fe transport
MVLRAATAEYSTQSVAGTINIVLRRAVRKTQREARLGYLLSEGAPALDLGASISRKWSRLDLKRRTYVGARADLEAYTVWKFNPKAQLRIALEATF